jgi:Secretion system C-terminal sorting domain
MKKYILLLILGLSFFEATAQGLSNQSRIGTNGYDIVGAVLHLPDGSYIVASNTDGDATGLKTTPSFGSMDGWLLRYDANHQLLWEKPFGGSGFELVKDMQLSSDQQILVLLTSTSPISGNKTVATKGGHDAWLLKLDWNGDIIWQQDYGTTMGDRACKLLVHPEGSIYVGVISNGQDEDRSTPLFGEADFWLLKLNSAGQKIWDRAYGSNAQDELTALQLEPYTNRVVLLGTVGDAGNGNMNCSCLVYGTNCWLFSIDNNGEIYNQTCLGSGTQLTYASLVFLPDGTCWLATNTFSGIIGNQTLPNFGNWDTWLLHLDANFQLIDQKIFGGTSTDYPISIQTNGQVLQLVTLSSSPVSGNKTQSCRGALDVWYLMLNAADGALMLQRTIGGSQNENAAVLINQENNVRFFIESASPQSGDKTLNNYTSIEDVWCVTMASTLGLDQPSPYASPTFKLYPNPAHESIEIENYSSAKEALLCDPTGKVLQRIALQDAQTTNLVVSHLTPGIYLIRVGEETRSLVLE